MRYAVKRGGAGKFMAALLCVCFLLMGAAVTAQESETEGTKETGVEKPYNLLLIGTDRRDESWNGNSDVMILITIHPQKEKIVMTSFMRDLYADIPGHGVHKLNYAFAVGGAEKLIETLEKSYQLSIDNHMIVNFSEMANIIDDVGGVEITLSDAECKVMNQYLNNMGVPQYNIYSGGTHLLNGYQAVGYMRIRYVGNSDYQRTQRQRDVLNAVFEKVKDRGAAELAELVAEILPEIEHDLSPLKILKLTTMLPELTGYELEENRIPYDDLYYSQNEMLVPDFAATIERLHEKID